MTKSPIISSFDMEQWLRGRDIRAAHAVVARAFIRELPLANIDAFLRFSDDQSKRQDTRYLLSLFQAGALAWLYAKYPGHVAKRSPLLIASSEELWNRLRQFQSPLGRLPKHLFVLRNAAISMTHLVRSRRNYRARANAAFGNIKGAHVVLEENLRLDAESGYFVLESDAARISKGINLETLLDGPIGVLSPAYMERYEKLKAALIARDEGWDVWLRWFDDRLAGAPTNPSQAFAYISNVDELQSRTVEEINHLIGRRLLRNATDPALEEPALPPPPIPRQEVGPYFALREDGVIDFAPATDLDTAGNNVALLRQLHPLLRESVGELIVSLSKGNAPYSSLLDRAKRYSALTERPLDQISFAQLFGAGVRLQNATTATHREIGRDELPTFDPNTDEQLNSVLQLHAAFILNSADGAALIAAEERYQRRPIEEAEYRQSAAAFAQELVNHPEVMDTGAATQVLEVVREIGTGEFPERSAVVGVTVTRNALISVIGLSMVAAAPIAVGAIVAGTGGAAIGLAVAWWPFNEALKKTKVGVAFTDHIKKTIDGLTHGVPPEDQGPKAAISSPYLAFVINEMPSLRRLATAGRQFPWLNQSLDWLEANQKRNAEIARQGEGLQ